MLEKTIKRTAAGLSALLILAPYSYSLAQLAGLV